MMSPSRFNVVIYGATGITGGKIFETLVSSARFDAFSVAVAGRSERKLREVIGNAEKLTGKPLENKIGVLICDATDATSMARMARRAELIVNAVGPFRLHGEAVVRAAVENGAHQIDVAGEPEWIERMEDEYAARARENGVIVVSACGWDSIPADLSVAMLKKQFDGQLLWIDAFVQLHFGESGYSFSATSLHALLLGFNGAAVPASDLGAVRRRIMPRTLVPDETKAVASGHLPKRSTLWRIDDDGGWALPFLGADKSIVTRSQYYEAVNEGVPMVHFNPYAKFDSRWNAITLALGMSLLKVAAQKQSLHNWILKHPSLVSGNMFSEEGPTEQQMREATFTYKFEGYGYGRGDSREEKPKKRMLVTCHGPDVGYIATSACVLSSVLVFLREKEKLPKRGGVYTTATAFRTSRILDYLADFGINFDIEFPRLSKL